MTDTSQLFVSFWASSTLAYTLGFSSTSLGAYMIRRTCLYTNPTDYFSWYRRSEFGTRVAFFFTAAITSGAFGEY